MGLLSKTNGYSRGVAPRIFKFMRNGYDRRVAPRIWKGTATIRILGLEPVSFSILFHLFHFLSLRMEAEGHVYQTKKT